MEQRHDSLVHLMVKHAREVVKKNPKTEMYCFEALELLKCGECEFQTHLQVNLKNHIDVTHHSSPTDHNLAELHRGYTCEKCHQQTYSIFVLARHTCKKSERICGKKKKKCPLGCECEQCLFREKHGTELFRCGHCSYKTGQKRGLKLHIKNMHTASDEIQWFRCEQCPFKAKTNQQVRRHTLRKHVPDVEAEWYECDQCAYETKIERDLKAHFVRMHNDVWFECHLCDYKGRSKIYLRKHQKMRHSKEEDIKWHRCERCEYKTKSTSHLKRHVLHKHLLV